MVDLGEVEGAGLLPVVHELVAEGDDLRLDHLAQQVVALAGALADAGEDREAAVLQGDVVDQLLDEHRLADAGAAEEAGLAAAGVGLEQVDDLDAGFEQLDLRRLLVERRRLAVDRPALLVRHRAELVHRVADDVEHAAEGGAADRNRDRLAHVLRRHAADDAVGRLHRDTAHAVLAKVLRDLGGEVDRHAGRRSRVLELDGIQDLRQLPLGVLDVDHRPDDLDDLADRPLGGWCLLRDWLCHLD